MKHPRESTCIPNVDQLRTSIKRSLLKGDSTIWLYASFIIRSKLPQSVYFLNFPILSTIEVFVLTNAPQFLVY
jgi:hypothetical protein